MKSEIKAILTGWVVLVIDDEADSTEVAQMLLELYGATVYTAPTGSEGLALARQLKPQLILSDLSMPEMTGWELIQHIKHDPDLCHLPVIALSAHVTSADREHGLSAGFSSYLTKPLKPKTFIQDLLPILQSIPTLATLLNKGDPP